MAGGAPAGIMRLPGEALCFATSAMINTITIKGNSRTIPRGTEILEFPCSRIRRLKKDSRGTSLSFSFVRSCRDGMLGDDGIRFMKSPTRPIMQRVNPRKEKGHSRHLNEHMCRDPS